MSSLTAARTSHLTVHRTTSRRRRLVRTSYHITLIGKALLGVSQLVGAGGLLMGSSGALARWVDFLTRTEIAEDPTDPLAHALTSWAQTLAPQAENFYAMYLLGHGALNFAVAALLWSEMRAAANLSIAVLVGFVLYQITEFARTGDPALLVLTTIDGIVIALALLEMHGRRDEQPNRTDRLAD